MKVNRQKESTTIPDFSDDVTRFARAMLPDNLPALPNSRRSWEFHLRNSDPGTVDLYRQAWAEWKVMQKTARAEENAKVVAMTDAARAKAKVRSNA